MNISQPQSTLPEKCPSFFYFENIVTLYFRLPFAFLVQPGIKGEAYVSLKYNSTWVALGNEEVVTVLEKGTMCCLSSPARWH